MKILKYKKHAKKELIKNLRKVILLNSEKIGKRVFVYKKTLIELKEVKIKDLVPLQLYQLKSSNQLVKDLHSIFKKEYREDIFHMNGYCVYESNDKKYTFIPPIVECVKNSNGKTQNVVIDGLHRMLLAIKLKRKTATVIVIKNIPQELILPVVPNEWEEMEIVEIAPKRKRRRKWLIPPEKGYLFYRDFNSAFENVGRPRK
ncbi:MAG: hypothetical protein A3B47_04960 [Candidatus Levybacteria bacterium RIFCSPLOWO2_01_FULL_39_24]|nr:MAG: hypothetical protein A2800_04325 [Candidatus Levybacteria bacterium RIFCSPHIGHO2_01_FULL_40_16]OGH27980.1 MAG: hypothetical protein A3E12_02710 [Candidatus Levybacteria bacterium RIFCSPHIGHO2_12_FULL_39_9]OGH46788.1 MAG: hypothetical protein A3B47_04960 [Candidatus Levybacteria bacterium RIFCSPLOWO2_01_FULL_39_24]